MHRSLIRRSAIAVLAVGLTAAQIGVTYAAHPDETTSAAIYRIPYQDGTLVDVSGDAHNHGGMNGNRDRIDMRATDGVGNTIVAGSASATGPAAVGDPAPVIVAAASGWIRVIEDDHGDDYGRGDGLDASGNAQADDSVEHLCTDNTVLNAGETCARHNNYVWIEHPNGEWTKYSHLRTGTVRGDNNWNEGDPIFVGDVIGEEGTVGFSFGPHLHFEVANLGAFTGTLPANIGNPGGFISTATFQNHNPRVCDATTADYEYVDDNDITTFLTAGDCVNTAPTANAGGSYVVDEGSTVMLDGTASTDIHNAVLIFSWSPGGQLDDPTIATPIYSAIDDTVDVITLTVDDTGGDVSAGEALTDSDDATVTVQNVAPTVTAVGDDIVEAGVATVSATVTDPGTADTHTATVDWDDGTAPEAVATGDLAAGVDHVYGDNGTYTVIVRVTDDDGGAGVDQAIVTVANVDPTVALDSGDAISFPGGDYLVAGAGGDIDLAADASDVGSDDLTFTWSQGDVNTYFNDGVAPDPFPSPLGTFPFAASDSTTAGFPDPGVETLTVNVSDDDGGTADDDIDAVIVGTADTTRGSGWWKHQMSGKGTPHIDDVTLGGYLEIVGAVSSVFSEATPAATAPQAHEVLSTGGDGARGRATADLLVAWLQFASGAVDVDATVPLTGGGEIVFLDLMFEAEALILNPATTDAALADIERDLMRVRHAGS